MKKIKVFIGEISYAPKHLINFVNSIRFAYKLAFSKKHFYELNGIKLTIDKQFITTNIYKSFLDGSYEQGEYHILSRVLDKNDRVFEIGTGMGYNSIFAATVVGSENVISFEANPFLIPIIIKNYELNNMHIRLENKFLVKDPLNINEVEFYLAEDFWASNTHPNPNLPMVKVKTASFIENLIEFNPNVILCDIEGGEIELLNIEFPSSIKKIIIDTHPFYNHIGDENNSELIRNLLNQGFTFKSTLSHGFAHFFERN